MYNLSSYNSKEEVAKIVSMACGIDIDTIINEFLPIILQYYHTLIENDEGFECCYFCLNDKYSVARLTFTEACYKTSSYDLEKLISKKIYRVSFDAYGVLLFKLFLAYLSSGIGGAIFSIIEQIIEYLITGNIQLSNEETCVLYTILLDSNCFKGYFDENYLYRQYYKGLGNREDTCFFNMTEMKCLFNKDINRCVLSQEKLKKIFEKLERKKILKLNTIGKYRINRFRVIK